MSDRGSAVRWLSRVRTCPLRPALPAGEIVAVEERAETGGWFGLGGAERGERGDSGEGEEEARDEAERGGGRGNGEVHGVLDRGCF